MSQSFIRIIAIEWKLTAAFALVFAVVGGSISIFQPKSFMSSWQVTADNDDPGTVQEPTKLVPLFANCMSQQDLMTLLADAVVREIETQKGTDFASDDWKFLKRATGSPVNETDRTTIVRYFRSFLSHNLPLFFAKTRNIFFPQGTLVVSANLEGTNQWNLQIRSMRPGISGPMLTGLAKGLNLMLRKCSERESGRASHRHRSDISRLQNFVDDVRQSVLEGAGKISQLKAEIDTESGQLREMISRLGGAIRPVSGSSMTIDSNKKGGMAVDPDVVRMQSSVVNLRSAAAGIPTTKVNSKSLTVIKDALNKLEAKLMDLESLEVSGNSMLTSTVDHASRTVSDASLKERWSFLVPPPVVPEKTDMDDDPRFQIDQQQSHLSAWIALSLLLGAIIGAIVAIFRELTSPR